MDVLRIDQAVVELPRAIERFRAEGVSAEPVIFGQDGRPEAVVLPFSLFDRGARLAEDLEIAQVVRARASAGPATSLEGTAADLGIDLSSLGRQRS